jgi:hypothetical protein
VIITETRDDHIGQQEQINITSIIANKVFEYARSSCAAVVLVRSRTIPKTTSGKIGHSHLKSLYEGKTLEVLYESRSADANQLDSSKSLNIESELSSREIRYEIISKEEWI